MKEKKILYGKIIYVKHVENAQFYKATTPHHVRYDTNLNGRVVEWCDVVLAVQIVVKRLVVVVVDSC